MDFNKLVKEKMDEIVANKLPEMVELKVTKMVESILKGLFSSYSDTAKIIKNKISEKLDVSLEKFTLVDYNSMVAKAIVDALGKEIDVAPIKEIVRGLIGKSTVTQLTLTTLCEKISEISQKENSSDYFGEFSFHVEENDERGWLEIFADLDENISKDKCSVRVLVSKDRGTIFSMKTSSFWHKRKETTPSDLITNNALENLFFSLYNNQVTIINDYESYYTTWERD